MSRPDGAADIGQRLKRRRLELGMTQQQLANRAGVAERTVRSAEAGETLSPYRLRDLMRALGMVDSSEERRIRDLLVGEGIPTEYAERAARVIAAEQPPSPPPAVDRPA